MDSGGGDCCEVRSMGQKLCMVNLTMGVGVCTHPTTPDTQSWQEMAHGLDEEDVAHDLKTALSVKARNGFFTANDVINIVLSPKIQAHFTWAGIDKPSISVSTTCRWLSRLGW